MAVILEIVNTYRKHPLTPRANRRIGDPLTIFNAIEKLNTSYVFSKCKFFSSKLKLKNIQVSYESSLSSSCTGGGIIDVEGIDRGGGGGGTPATGGGFEAGGGGGCGAGTPTRKEDRLFSGDVSDDVGGGNGGAPTTGGGGGIPVGGSGCIPTGRGGGIPVGRGSGIPLGGGIRAGGGGGTAADGGIPVGGGIPTRQEDVRFVTEDRLFSGDNWDKVGGRDGCLASVPVDESPILMLFVLGTTKSFRELMASVCFDSFRTGSELKHSMRSKAYY